MTVDKNNARIRKLHYDVDHFFFYGYFFVSLGVFTEFVVFFYYVEEEGLCLCWLHLFSLWISFWYIRGAHYTMYFDGQFSKDSFSNPSIFDLTKNPLNIFEIFVNVLKKICICHLNLTSFFPKKWASLFVIYIAIA